MRNANIQNSDIAIIGDELTITRNGKAANCPFRNPTPLPHPNIKGQLVIHVPTCNESCIFFEIKPDFVRLECTGKIVEPSNKTILQKGKTNGIIPAGGHP